MATIGQNFVYVSSGTLVIGSATVPTPAIVARNPKVAADQTGPIQVTGGSGSPVSPNGAICADVLVFNPGLTAIPDALTPVDPPVNYGTVLCGYAKNGAVWLSLSGTTAQTLDLNNTAMGPPAGTAGDTQFLTCYVLRIKNLGTAAVTIAPGASNPSPFPPLTGTYTIAAGSEALFHTAAGVAISATACNLTFTPAATGNVLVTIGGS